MNTLYVLPLSDEQAVLETVGGKGMSLARLTRSGLPVPGGFHITTAAYQQFVADNNLWPAIQASLAETDVNQTASLEATASTIQALFQQAATPPVIEQAIRTAYAAVGRPDAPVAVRSSATAEDLPDASFAGQQETYLNICGAAAVLEAVKKCWASPWTARAIAYRSRQGIAPETVALAVVVQELVFADAAGVLFSANPVNGRRGEVMITAAWGLGEALVSGAVTPDTLVLNKQSGKLLQREIACKQVMTVRTPQGTHEEPVPPARQKQAVLTKAQAAELARIGVQIEQLYGMPMDVEWTLAAGKFAIVQARPITSLPPSWERPQPQVMYARGSFAEFVPDVVSPLFATLAIPIAEQETIRLMNDVLQTNLPDSYAFEVVNGYVYVGIPFRPGLLARFTWATLTRSKWMLSTGKQRWLDVRQRSQDLAAQWRARELASLPAADLLDGARQLFRMTATYYTVAQSGPIPSASSSEVSFSRFYASLVQRKDDPEATVFLLGQESQPLRAEKSLYDLAQWARSQPELAGFLLHTPAEEICAALQADPVPAPLAGEFAARFAAHLAEFGHALYDLDFSRPLPVDEPAPLVEALRAYLEGKGRDPYARQQAQLERSQQAEQAISQRLGSLRRKWFFKLLKWARDCNPVREDCIADIGLCYPQLRRLLAELGRRMAAAGALPEAGDIYWLEAQEAEALAAALDQGQPLASQAAQIEERKARYQKERSVTPPATLPEKTWMTGLLVHDNPDGAALKGYGASAGKVTAPACVLHGPEDFGQMHPGDVIVAVTTTPAWTPLFALASAVVTDIGGPLSHSSIVAREYGIPAVMATGVASKRIQNGQLITVDGGAGLVTLN